MAKQFAKVTQTYSTKNKLQLVILNELKTVDFTLYPDKQTAKKSIEMLFYNAVQSYKGKAAAQTLKQFEPNKTTLTMSVDEVITISIYTAKIDLT